jgi:hypothetical protein
LRAYAAPAKEVDKADTAHRQFLRDLMIFYSGLGGKNEIDTSPIFLRIPGNRQFERASPAMTALG